MLTLESMSNKELSQYKAFMKDMIEGKLAIRAGEWEQKELVKIKLEQSKRGHNNGKSTTSTTTNG